jgi:Ser/Thr protein kinase RdoA (MazF antagonist)
MKDTQQLATLFNQFDAPGRFTGAEPWGSGHINDTYRIAYDNGTKHFILQRVNHHVFRQPVELMDNIRRVTAHLQEKLAGTPDVARRVLMLVPTRDGRPFVQDPTGGYWRAYRFIEGAQTFQVVESPAQARAAAQALGQFQRLLADLPPPRLHDTIPDFHHTPKRYAALEAVLVADPCNRAAAAKREIEFARQRESIVGTLLALNLPERVTHNDTKLNNVLFDTTTGEALCIVDLDTVMPGLALYDFGDMVRTICCRAAEDERDLAKVRLDRDLFTVLAGGYLAEASVFLTPVERQHLAFAGQLITFELGLRFLTDHLQGDTYFKIHRPSHNLDRCRTQFALVASMEQQEDAMQRVVEIR